MKNIFIGGLMMVVLVFSGCKSKHDCGVDCKCCKACCCCKDKCCAEKCECTECKCCDCCAGKK